MLFFISEVFTFCDNGLEYSALLKLGGRGLGFSFCFIKEEINSVVFLE